MLAVVLVAAPLLGSWSASVGASTSPGQVITVRAAHAWSTTAVLRTWRRTGGGRYVQVFAAVVANVGVRGVGRTHEGAERTPAGVFTLTQAFGNAANDGTRLHYFRAGPNDWWDENPSSLHYNRHVHSSSSPGGASENLYDAGYVYSHAVVINYNMNPVVKGAGSGFFLHVSADASTEGCVSIPATRLTQIMRWLNPALHPVISIGVGPTALEILTS